MSVLIMVIVLATMFGILVGIHEFGHFIAAKLQGVWVEEFAFGFGPNLFQKKYHGTVYKINLIPLGGYVKLFGERTLVVDETLKAKFEKMDDQKEDQILKVIKENKLNKIDDEEDLRSAINKIEGISEEDKDWIWLLEMNSKQRVEDTRRYSNKTIMQRLIIVCAGVFMNFVFGIIIYSLYLGLVNNIVLIPKITQYDFLGANVKSLEQPFFSNIENKEYEELEGTVLVKINDLYIDKTSTFTREIEANKNESVKLTYYKNGKIEEGDFVLYKEQQGLIDDQDLQAQIIGINKESPAEKAGLMKGDVILSVNDEIVSFTSLKDLLFKYKGQTVTLDIMSEDKVEKEVEVELLNPSDINGVILGAAYDVSGLSIVPGYYIDYSKTSFGGFFHSINMLGYQFGSIKEIFGFAIKSNRPDIIAETVSGPIRVGAEVNNFIKVKNTNDIINLAALISLTLAIMNILPLPVVDGGHVVLLLLEKLRGKPVSDSFLGIYNIVGLVFLLTLTLVITIKDFWQVFLR